MVDLIDEKLLSMLEKNAKMTNQEIADNVGLTEGAVRRRIKVLEQSGIVVGYKARIKYHLLDKTHMIVGLDISPESFNSVILKLKGLPEINELYTTTGDHVAIFVAAVKSSQANEFVKRIEGIKGIRHVYPAFVQEIVK